MCERLFVDGKRSTPVKQVDNKTQAHKKKTTPQYTYTTLYLYTPKGLREYLKNSTVKLVREFREVTGIS